MQVTHTVSLSENLGIESSIKATDSLSPCIAS